jgi:hypothetical protein
MAAYEQATVLHMNWYLCNLHVPDLCTVPLYSCPKYNNTACNRLIITIVCTSGLAIMQISREVQFWCLIQKDSNLSLVMATSATGWFKSQQIKQQTLLITLLSSLDRVSLSLSICTLCSVVAACVVKLNTTLYHKMKFSQVSDSRMVVADGQFCWGQGSHQLRRSCHDCVVVAVGPNAHWWFLLLLSLLSLLLLCGCCNCCCCSMAACCVESNGSDELRRYNHQGQRIKVDVMAFAGEVTCKSPTPIWSWSL